MKRIIPIAFLGALAGCAQEPPAAPVAPVKVQVVGHDYCAILRRINGGDGRFRWSVQDTPPSITSMRRANAALVKRCPASPPTNPATS